MFRSLDDQGSISLNRGLNLQGNIYETGMKIDTYHGMFFHPATRFDFFLWATRNIKTPPSI